MHKCSIVYKCADSWSYCALSAYKLLISIEVEQVSSQKINGFYRFRKNFHVNNLLGSGMKNNTQESGDWSYCIFCKYRCLLLCNEDALTQYFYLPNGYKIFLFYDAQK